MPLIIGSLIIEKADDKTLDQVIREIQKLQALPVSNKVYNQPEHAVTLLQREFAVITDDEKMNHVATLDSMECILVVLKGKTSSGKAVHITSHIDTTNQYHFEDSLNSIKGGSVDVYLIGGEDGYPDSITTLKNFLKYLITVANDLNITFEVKGQRIWKDFLQTKADMPHQCSNYILQKAVIAYQWLFNKPLPVEFYNLNFGIEKPEVYISTVPNLENTLATIQTEVRQAKAGDLDQKKELATRLMPLSMSFVSQSGLNLQHFCGFLFLAGSYDELKNKFMSISPVFAPNEAQFQDSLKALFTPLGYDAIRFMLMLNGNFQKVKYTSFAWHFHENYIVPISRKYHCLSGFEVRMARVMDFSTKPVYYASYTSHIPCTPPKFNQKFLQLCDEYSAQFKNPQLVLSESQITAMCAQFRIDSKTNIKRRQLCAMLHYYVNHRDEFHESIESSMSAIMVKFKNPNDYNLTFRSVAFNGSVNELTIMIQSNNAAPNSIIDINASGTSKMTALHQAVRSKSLNKVKLLLTPDVLKNQKIVLDGFSNDGKTPLHIAWEKDTRNLQIFEALLNAGAKPDIICDAYPVSLMKTLINSNDSDVNQFLDAIRQLYPNMNCK